MTAMGHRDDQPAFLIDHPDPGHPEFARFNSHRTNFSEQVVCIPGIDDGLVHLADSGIEPAGFQEFFLQP